MLETIIDILAVGLPCLFLLFAVRAVRLWWHRRGVRTARRLAGPFVGGADAAIIQGRSAAPRASPTPSNGQEVANVEGATKAIEKATRSIARAFEQLCSEPKTITKEERTRLLQALAQQIGRCEAYAQTLSGLKNVSEQDNNQIPASAPGVAVGADEQVAQNAH